MDYDERLRRGKILQRIRKRARPTIRQEDLADMVGVSTRVIGGLERGEPTSDATMDLVLEKLGVDESVFEAGGGHAPTSDIEPRDMDTLRRYPREVFIALIVWGAWLKKLPPDEQSAKIEAMSMILMSDHAV